MRNPLNQTIQQIKPSGIRRFFGLAADMDDVVSLGVGEPDFDTPWHIRESAMQSIRKGQTFYSPNAGLLELRQAIAAFNKRKYALDYNPTNEIIVTLGASEAIDLVFRAMLDEGDEVIVPEPTYVSYKPSILLAKGVPVTLPLKEENGFCLTVEELEAAITEKTKILLLVFPNNPTGAIMTKESLEAIAEVVKKHDIFVVSDEIYSELTYTKIPHFSIAALDQMKERTIVLNGFSKAFSMTGWRLGYALGPKEIIEGMLKIHQFTVIGATTFVQYAAIDALRESDEDIERMKTAYNQRRRYLMNAFKQMGLHCFEPQGAFYVFLNIKPFGLSSETFCERLLYEQRLAVVPGSAFGESGEGFVRISYAYSLEQLQEAMKRLEKFIHSLTK